MKIPTKLIEREVSEPSKQAILSHFEAQNWSIHPTLLNVFCSRGVQPDSAVGAILAGIRNTTRPDLLPDVEKAAARIAENIMQCKRIGLVCDYDTDGSTGGATLYLALIEHFLVPKENITVYIGERLTEGYGLSDGLADRIIADPNHPDLIITIDNGSSDADRISRLKTHGIEVIVTDHHEIPSSGIPADALAVVSPARTDSEYGDHRIAGCAVAFLLACHLKDHLEEQCWLPEATLYPMELLGYVAVGTVADCVSMSESVNNRAFVKAGLDVINRCERPCWRVYRQLMMESTEHFQSATIGFGIGPLINAAGRVADPFTAFRFLTATTDEEAHDLLRLLIADNTNRKELEQEMRVTAIEIALKQVQDGQQMVIVHLPDGHPGVHGITASRVVERTGKPVAIFSPKDPQGKILTASLRSVDGIHIRDVLESVSVKLGDDMLGFGGHIMAAGTSIKATALDAFITHAQSAVKEQMDAKELKPDDLQPVCFHDGLLAHRDISLDFLHQLQLIAPYGRGFEEPKFIIEAEVASVKLMGADQNHARITLRLDTGLKVNAVWFFCTDSPEYQLVATGKKQKLVCQLSENHWNGSSSIQLMASSLVSD